MNTVERQLRMQAQSLATIEEQRSKMQQVITDQRNDIVMYKEYVQKMFSHIDNYVNTKVCALQTTLDTTVNDNFNLLAEKLQILQASYNSLLEQMPRSGPQRFNLEQSAAPMTEPLASRSAS